MDDTFTDGVYEEEDQEAEEVDDDGGLSEITVIYLSAYRGIGNSNKYLMRFRSRKR